MWRLKIGFHSLWVILFFAFLSTSCAENQPPDTGDGDTYEVTNFLFGVNLSGAEFGGRNLPGKYKKHYIYPKDIDIEYFVDKGMNVFRLPFRWERLQAEQNAPFEPLELERIEYFVTSAVSKGARVILNPHNYARYYGEVVGTEGVPVSAFEDFWSKLARHFKDNPSVIFGLMNEPFRMPSELWRDNANAAIAAIRATGARNLILVPGNGWTGAHSWKSDWYGTPNAETMLTIVDPLDHYAFEVHQYLDKDSSGTSSKCVDATIGSKRLIKFTAWLNEHNKKGFLGEFGVGDDPTCLEALDDMLAYIQTNNDVWLGWTWWSAGPWWGDYAFSVQPDGAGDKPQMRVLQQYLPGP